jgi:transposase
MTAIAITRTDMTAVELRVAAGREKDGCAARRMLALAMVFEGVNRASAATRCGMDRQILRDRVLRYNEQGLAGLHNRKAGGRPPRLSLNNRRLSRRWSRRVQTLPCTRSRAGADATFRKNVWPAPSASGFIESAK